MAVKISRGRSPHSRCDTEQNGSIRDMAKVTGYHGTKWLNPVFKVIVTLIKTLEFVEK